MRKRMGFPVLLCILIIFLSGCVNLNTDLSPESPPPLITISTTIQTTTPALVTAVPTATKIHTTAVTVPAACKDLAAAASEDKAFLNLVNNYQIVTGIYSLAYTECNIADASELNQLIANHAKPMSTELLSARKALMSATSECIGETKSSVVRSRTLDDIENFRSKLVDYKTAITPCKAYLSADPTGPLQQILDSLKNQKGQAFSGTGNDLVSFNVATSGTWIFHSEFLGKNRFLVQIYGDTPGKYIFNYTAPQSGNTVMRLEPGKYYFNIKSDGPWSIAIRPK
jgi:hypothetical protein